MSIGRPINRVEARSKVTGEAAYTADLALHQMAHAVLLGSTIAAGRIRAISPTSAEAAPGVLAVLTHENIAPWHGTPDDLRYVETRFPLADDRIHHHGQYVAVVVARTREHAEYAAGLVEVQYDEEPAVGSLDAALPTKHPPDWRFEPPYPSEQEVNDPLREFDRARVKIEAEYRTPYHSHVPIEPNATLAQWRGDYLTMYETSQGVYNDRRIISGAFGIPDDHVRVSSVLVGGAFGNKAAVWPHTLLAAAAARVVGRPVRLVATRQQVFTSHGHQPPIIQTLRFGAYTGEEPLEETGMQPVERGRLRVLIHETVNGSPHSYDHPEGAFSPTATVYRSHALRVRLDVAGMHMPTPVTLRTPADGPGMFAVGSAIDELSYALAMDPLEVRRRNDLPFHPIEGKPWSGKQLLECYDRGASLFGWSHRASRPRAMRDGDDWVGFGMSSAQRLEHHSLAEARVRVLDDGTGTVLTSVAEIGTGNLTTMVQIAADGMGIPPSRTTIVSGDTDLPEAPPTTGSRTSGSTGTAVHLAAQRVRRAAIQLAIGDRRSPLYGLPGDRVLIADGRLYDERNPRRGETYQRLLRRNGKRSLSRKGIHHPRTRDSRFSYATFGAHFTEVRVNVNVPRVRITRHVGVFAIGRVLNPKTARSQAQGGIVFAAGQTLMEDLAQDPSSGRFVTPALTDYHIPVNADVGRIDVDFVEEPDYNAHPLGAKGLGEVVCVGVHASIANAVYHATGIRVRDLPIIPDKLAAVVRDGW